MEKRNLAQQTADSLYARIVNGGAWGPGDRLPNENDLAEQLGVSRGTLREAIRLLTAQGILTAQKGRGTFVAENASLPGRFDLENLPVERSRLADLFEARLLLEPELAALACRRASREELARILALAEQVRRMDDSVHVACMKGDLALDDVLAGLDSGTDERSLWLMPLLTVSGRHARHDMAGRHNDRKDI